MPTKWIFTMLVLVFLTCQINAQTESAFESSESGSKGLLDPSKLSIHHSLSFGMAGNSTSALKSQSLYSTMMTYQFSAPVTLNLNFGFPIHSTFSQSANLNAETISSADYLYSMPLDVSLTWQPRDNLFMQFSFIRDPGTNSGVYPYLGHRRYLFPDW